MILQVMVLYDGKARAHMEPFFVKNVEIGCRAFAGAANDPAHSLFHYADDFTLFHLGEFNDETGRFNLKPQAVNLGLARQFQKPAATPPAQRFPMKEA